jgi:hypothetical protein
MTTRTYIVVLKSGVSYNTVWQEIESATSGLAHVPNRPVAIVNERPMFKRICEYELTDAEADTLRQDSRIESVEIPVRDLPNVEIVSTVVQNARELGPYPGMNFNKQPGNVTVNNPARYDLPYGASINWGLIRHTNKNNPYGINTSGISGLTTTQNYTYALDGTGVDVLISDSGIQSNHPEFTNSLGQSRVKFVDWNQIARTLGIPLNPLPNRSWNTLSYSDSGNDLINEHGTHVAGIAVGKTYGWAKNANIISLYQDFPPSGRSYTDPFDTFEMMLYWHQTKGNKNPTIVNMSWELRLNLPTGTVYYLGISGGNYRGTTWSGLQTNEFYQARGLIPLIQGLPFQSTAAILPYASAAYNAALAELIDAGIVVVQAAGNNRFKMDKPLSDGGTGDYDNYITSFILPGLIYYQRGASPKDPRAIVVGALDTLTSNTGQDLKAQFSSTGPRIDVYAAGTYVMSAGSNTSSGGGYYPNPKFKELVLNGTSMASPQVTGMCALYLQSHKPSNIYNANNCSTVKSWVVDNATTNTFYETGNTTSYTNYLSLLGGSPRVAYQPLQGITYAKSAGWQQVANVYVRGVSSWEPVRAAYTKTDAGWIQIF